MHARQPSLLLSFSASRELLSGVRGNILPLLLVSKVSYRSCRCARSFPFSSVAPAPLLGVGVPSCMFSGIEQPATVRRHSCCGQQGCRDADIRLDILTEAFLATLCR